MDLRFVGILFIFGSCLAAVFLHCLDRFLLGRNLKRVCKSQELPGPRKCSPHKCDPLLDSYFPSNPNTMCGYIPPPPSYEHEYLPHSSGPTNTRPSFFNWASCRALLPHSSGHDLPQFSGPTNTPANFLDWGSGRAPSNEHQYSCLSSSFPESAKPLSTSILHEILRESFKSKGSGRAPSNEHQYSCLSSSSPESAKPLSGRDLNGPPPHSSEHDLPESSDPADILPKSDSWKVRCDRETEILAEIIRESFKSKGPLPSSPMGPLPSSPMGPIDKGYVKHFPVTDLHRNQLLALQNWARATAMNKLPEISAAATSVTGCDSAHVIGMDEWKDCSAAQPTGEALMNNLL